MWVWVLDLLQTVLWASAPGNCSVNPRKGTTLSFIRASSGLTSWGRACETEVTCSVYTVTDLISTVNSFPDKIRWKYIPEKNVISKGKSEGGEEEVEERGKNGQAWENLPRVAVSGQQPGGFGLKHMRIQLQPGSSNTLWTLSLQV